MRLTFTLHLTVINKNKTSLGPRGGGDLKSGIKPYAHNHRRKRKLLSASEHSSLTTPSVRQDRDSPGTPRTGLLIPTVWMQPPLGTVVCAGGERPEDEPQEPGGTNTLTPELGSMEGLGTRRGRGRTTERAPPHPASASPSLDRSEHQGGSRQEWTRAHEETKNPHAHTDGHRRERSRPSQYRKMMDGGTG